MYLFIDLPPVSTTLHESGLPKATQNTTLNTKSKNKHNHGKKVTLLLLSTLSPNKTSAGMHSFILFLLYKNELLEELARKKYFTYNFLSIADRLTNIEKTLNSLIVHVNTFGEDIRSIMMQLKSSSKIIKNIRNVGVITQVFLFLFLAFL